MLDANQTENRPSFLSVRCFLEISGIVVIFAALCWSPPPDANEAHYLCKAKHFWNPQFCKGDLFLESANAHWFFLASFGLLPQFLSLEHSAWVGRTVCWSMLAIGWRSLVRNFIDRSLLIVLSSGLYVMVNRLGHLAGEWVVGGVEGKSAAYAVLFLAISAAIQKRHAAMWFCLALATLFHALIGLWGTVIVVGPLVLNLIATKGSVPGALPNRKQHAIGSGLFVLLAGLSVIPIVRMNSAVSFDVANRVYEIQVTQRLAHHQYLLAFAPERFLCFAAMLSGFFLVYADSHRDPKYRRLLNMALMAIGVSICGALLSLLCAFGFSTSTWLRLYWFRISDAIVPISLAVLLPHLLSLRFKLTHRVIATTALTIVVISAIAHGAGQVRDGRPGADRQSLATYPESPRRTYETYKNWLKVCQWIRENTRANAVFITPIRQQTFKWNAERAEVVCWKDAPQDVQSFNEWYSRIEVLHQFDEQNLGLLELPDDEIAKLARNYRADYLIVPQRCFDATAKLGEPTTFKMVYPLETSEKSTFVVLQLPGSNENPKR